MKRFVVIIGALLCAVSVSSAKEHLEDSLAVRLSRMNSVFPGSLAYSMSQIEGLDNSQRLAMEYVVYRMSRDSWDKTLTAMSENDLEDMLDAVRYISSNVLTHSFSKTMSDLMEDAVNYESGQLQYFTYGIRDLEYGYLADRFFKALREPSASQTEMNALTRQYSQAAEQRMASHMADIRKMALIETVSLEELREAVFLLESPVIMANMHALDRASSSLCTNTQAEMLTRMYGVSGSADKDDLCRYASISRSTPYVFKEKYRPYKEILIKKDTYYSGQTSDGRPEGKGTLTDKKGVRYEGDFHNGLRHGLLTVFVPGEAPVDQVWIEDKYVKGLSADPGTETEAGEYLGHRYGFGKSVEHLTKTTIQGFFIDGKLQGNGLMDSPVFTMEGCFEKGDFREGTIVRNGLQWKKNMFTGKVLGDYRVGTNVCEMADGSYYEEQAGSFLDGFMDGAGRQVVMSKGDTTVREGLFVIGEMYGDGVIKAASKPDQSGIRETSVYKGGLLNTSAYGMGKAELTLYELPEGLWRFARYGIVISEVRGGDVLHIVMDGRFVEGVFVEGKVSVPGQLEIEGVFEQGGLKNGTLTRTAEDGTVSVQRYENGSIVE